MRAVKAVAVLVAVLTVGLFVAGPTSADSTSPARSVWTLAPVPGPHAATIPAGDGPILACPAPSYCQLLTDYQYATRLDGRGAKTVDPPDYYTQPYQVNDLRDISCARVGDCVATGESYQGPWDTPAGYRDELADGTWTAEAGTPAYEQVACNVDRCVEIGTQDVGIERGVLDDRTAGGSWVGRALTTPWQTPRDDGIGIGVDAVACPPSGPCYAFGHAVRNYREDPRSLFFYRDGRGWRGVPIAPPAGAVPGSAHLGATLTCPQTRTCLALGTYVDQAGGGQRVFAETYANGTLSAAPVALPPRASGRSPYLDDLSCTTGADCAGVVSWFGSDSLLYQALLRYHAGVWSSQLVSAAGAQVGSAPYVYAAACPSSTRCLAVGRFFRGTSSGLVNSPAMWTWRATGGWTVQLLPRPTGLAPGASGELTAIACPGATRCYLGGSYAGNAVYGVGTLSG